MKLFVEGGGAGALRNNCRAGFRSFLEKAGLRGKMPRIVACGSRKNAYRDYCNALKRRESAMLLVDSEAPVNPEHQAGQAADWQPWRHLKARDNWPEPAGATDADCHLMVQCMESWFLADRDTLAGYFGHGFRGNALPATDAIEGIAKEQVMDGLQQATHACPTKGRYNKGQHSFELLGKIRPRRVCDQSPWARRFIGRLETKMSA